MSQPIVVIKKIKKDSWQHTTERRTLARKRNIYSNYMEEIYENNKCILCEENKIDDREHYKTCQFSTKAMHNLQNEIKQIFVEKGINKKIYLWFGEKDTQDEDNMTWNELKISDNSKLYGDNFYVPIGIKEYFKELGLAKEWKSCAN